MIERVDSKESEQLSTDEAFKRLESSSQGLASAEAQRCLEQFGRNALEEKKVGPLRKFLGYFWGLIPWMIEVAAVLSGMVRQRDDFVIILVLLIFNAVIGV